MLNKDQLRQMYEVRDNNCAEEEDHFTAFRYVEEQYLPQAFIKHNTWKIAKNGDLHIYVKGNSAPARVPQYAWVIYDKKEPFSWHYNSSFIERYEFIDPPDGLGLPGSVIDDPHNETNGLYSPKPGRITAFQYDKKKSLPEWFLQYDWYLDDGSIILQVDEKYLAIHVGNWVVLGQDDNIVVLDNRSFTTLFNLDFEEVPSEQEEREEDLQLHRLSILFD